jgi:hypothetical protein
MKTIFALCGLSLVIGGVLLYRTTREPNRFGAFAGASRAEVSDLIGRPKDYLHKTVTIDGEVREQCTSMGCYFFFLAGKEKLRIDIQEIAMTAPRRNGRKARVEGQIVPYGDGYQFVASAVEFI